MPDAIDNQPTPERDCTTRMGITYRRGEVYIEDEQKTTDPTPDEMDECMATVVMGWEKQGDYWYRGRTSRYTLHESAWHPSGDHIDSIAQAMECLEKWLAQDARHGYTAESAKDGGHMVTLSIDENTEPVNLVDFTKLSHATAPTLQAAITLALWRAMKEQE